MLAVIVILLGVALEIAKANAWFIVPDFATYIVFGIGLILLQGKDSTVCQRRLITL